MLAAFVVVICRIVVLSVFILSASGKALNVSAFQESVSEFRLLPPGWSKAVAWTILGTEFVVVLLVGLGGGMLLVGFLLAAGLLIIFSTALVIALRRNVRTTCNCFGRTRRRVSPYDVARNALLILCSLVGVWALGSPLQSLYGIDFIPAGFVAVCFVALVVNLRDVAETLRQPFSID